MPIPHDHSPLNQTPKYMLTSTFFKTSVPQENLGKSMPIGISYPVDFRSMVKPRKTYPSFQSPVKMRLTLHIVWVYSNHKSMRNSLDNTPSFWIGWLVCFGGKNPDFIFIFLEYLPQKIPDPCLELVNTRVNTNYITFPKSELIHRLTRGSLAMIFSWSLIEMTDDNSCLLITALMVW